MILYFQLSLQYANSLQRAFKQDIFMYGLPEDLSDIAQRSIKGIP